MSVDFFEGFSWLIDEIRDDGNSDDNKNSDVENSFVHITHRHTKHTEIIIIFL